jgi:hypothetical protein
MSTVPQVYNVVLDHFLSKRGNFDSHDEFHASMYKRGRGGMKRRLDPAAVTNSATTISQQFQA